MVGKSERVHLKIWREIFGGYKEGGGEREHCGVHGAGEHVHPVLEVAGSDQSVYYVVELLGVGDGGVLVVRIFLLQWGDGNWW